MRNFENCIPTKIVYINLQTNSFYSVLLLILFFKVSIAYGQIDVSQEKQVISDSLNPKEIEKNKVLDSIPKKEPLLLDLINYNAQDSVKIDQKENKIRLYNKAILTYEDMTLEAGIIVLDYTINEVYAGRIADSLGVLSQKPKFIQGQNEVNPDSIRFNFDTKKALIWNSKTEQSGMNVFSDFTKKENDSVYYIKDAKVTTSSDPLNPDYYIRIRKGKMVPGGKIVAGLSNIYIANVPTPIGVPFAYFPTTNEKASGVIFPTYGESQQRGYYIQNGGYYLNISEYFDLNLSGDYYTNGSYGLRFDSQYRVNYKFGGNFSFRYEKLVNGERGFPNYNNSTVYNIRWTHRRDSKASPTSNFSASVNLGSSSYFSQSVNQLNDANFLNNTLSSSVSFSKTFPKYPRVNISLTTSLSQNTKTKTANLTLPTFQANMERIFPFAPKVGVKKGFIQNINFQYSTRGESRIQTTEEKLFKKEMFEDARAGMSHNIPLSTNFKVLKHLSISTSANYKEIWTPETVKYNNFNEEKGVVKDTIKGFDAFRQYNYSASLGTTIYGTFNFKEGKKIQSIRHTMRPAISYSVQPSFEKYYDEYIIDAKGNTAEYTRFETALFGRPSRGKSRTMGISLSNNFEAKIRSKDTLDPEPKKIKILNNLNFSTSYNFTAEQFNLSPVRVTTGASVFKDKININLSATMDPYALDENNLRINTLNIDNGGGLVRFTSANMNTNFELSNEDFKKKDKEEKEKKEEEENISRSEYERLSGGGRDDDLFGVSNNFSDNRFQKSEEEEKKEEKSTSLYRTLIPWSIKVAHSITYRNNSGQNEIGTNSLMLSGDIDLTPKWAIGFSSGYDFKQKGVTYTQFRFDRDLESWRLNFSWVPFGTRSSWSFFIGIKSGLLSDLKYDKRNEPDKEL
ncbi:MAG: organic solvent tolerance protein OstA [Flavobacteriales bacterium]|nr:organic solvent tolerance protein OstA [Candidatus Arcticimaribacter sp.]